MAMDGFGVMRKVEWIMGLISQRFTCVLIITFLWLKDKNSGKKHAKDWNKNLELSI